jgi:hypothetical protein
MMLDATIAGDTANSYLTLEEAAALAAVDLGRDAAAWRDADDEALEAALIQATLDVDAYGTGQAEVQYDVDQALRYPRAVDVLDDEPILPRLLKQATYEQAKYRLYLADAIVDARARRARGYASFSGDDGAATMSLHPEIERWSDAARKYLDVVLGSTTKAARGGTIVAVQLTGSYS